MPRYHPYIKAVRTRLYEVIDQDTNRLENKEGVVFNAPPADIFYIGEFVCTSKVSKSAMTELVLKQRGFTYLEFTKVSTKKTRKMYGLITSIKGNDVFMQDLEHDYKTAPRRCKLENITTLISNKVRYTRK